MSPFLFVLTQFAILAYALLGGVFLAYSDFIMRSLSLTRGAGGVEAMQIINREVFRWMFMTLFLGTALVSLLIAGFSATGLEGQARLLGRPPPGGPGQILVHERPLRQGWRGRRSWSGWRRRPLQDLRCRRAVAQ